jgi:hypothetical protein
MARALPLRFRDDRTTVWAFGDKVVVVCPRCAGMAQVVRRPGSEPVDRRFLGPRRLACSSCGYSRDHDGRQTSFPSKRTTTVGDPFFGAELWLQLPTRHGLLWAYNLRHLAYVEQFVAARIRERPASYDIGRKMTLIARLPRWLKQARNRDENLRNIARLRNSHPIT